MVVLLTVLAMVSPLWAISSAQAAVVRSTLSLSPSMAIRGERVKVSGTLPGVYSRAAWVQRKSGTAWVTIGKANTTRTGTYATSLKAPAIGSYSLRTLAPRVSIAGRVRAQYVTSAKTLKVVAQTTSLSMPAALVAAKTATATLTFRPVRAGRTVALQIARSGVWVAVAAGRQSATGTASLRMTSGTANSYFYRAWTGAAAGAPAFAGPTLTLKVTAPPPIPVAQHVVPVPSVGALFNAGPQGRHSCSASVVRSPSRDLVLTAAHCIIGTGVGIQFVPAYNQSRMPYGVWAVVGVYVDPSWKSRQDPQHDVAILKMGRQQRGSQSVGVEDVVGGNVLGVAPPTGAQVHVPAYPAGINDDPISCVSSIYLTAGYPGFDCHLYVGGTSGAPFLSPIGNGPGQVVVGVIGGLHQGGCLESTSYSSSFGSDTQRMLTRATLGTSPDVLPHPGGSDC